jgi:hypothetical protein
MASLQFDYCAAEWVVTLDDRDDEKSWVRILT